ERVGVELRGSPRRQRARHRPGQDPGDPRRGARPRAQDHRETLPAEAMIREVLRMGDPRLWQKSLPVAQFDAPELSELLQDMRDTMAHLNGAGLAAPQIGV